MTNLGHAAAALSDIDAEALPESGEETVEDLDAATEADRWLDEEVAEPEVVSLADFY